MPATKNETAKSRKKAAPKPSKNKPVRGHEWTDGGDRVLILRRINMDGTSYGGFSAWGKIGEPCEVSAPDFDAKPNCGGGLHGWPWGMGLGEGQEYSLIDDRWLVLAAKPEDVVGELNGGEKCKVRCAQKIYDGAFSGAWSLINGGRHRLIDAMAKCGAPGTASGYYSAAASSGNYSTAASSGDSSKAASSGNYSAAASSGNYSAAASSGNSSTAASSGYYSKAASSGNSSAAASSGYSSAAASSGNYSAAASSGNYSTAASSGDSSKAASSGNSSAAASSGYSSAAASSGNYSTAASSGYYSKAAQEGSSGIAASIGSGGMAKAGERGCVIVCWWNDAEQRYRSCVGYVGENGIKANTFYRVEHGVLREVT